MEATELVRIIRQSLVENDNAVYRDLLNNTDNATDPAWKGFLPIYKNLSGEQRDSLLQFLKVIQVNTVSSVLGIIDGTHYLPGIEAFELKTINDDKVINGDLQELFLTLVEEEN